VTHDHSRNFVKIGILYSRDFVAPLAQFFSCNLSPTLGAKLDLFLAFIMVKPLTVKQVFTFLLTLMEMVKYFRDGEKF
jgi:hypothetical protein